MDADIVTGVRQALQDVLAPEVQQLKGKIEALDARITALEKVIDARFAGVDSRFSEVNAKLDAPLNIHNLELRLAKLEAKSAN